jgi:hypothetical protein
MGEIVPLPTGSWRRNQAPPPKGPAKILFFIGVRYGLDHEGRSIRRPEPSRHDCNSSGDKRA